MRNFTIFNASLKIVLTGMLLCTLSCSDAPTNETPAVDLRTRYTFSQGKSIDFSVAGGAYQIVYNYSVPVDTMFCYSGAFLYGEDSLIYAQVRRTRGEFEEESKDIDPDYYHGEVTDLIMYNGYESIVLTPPYFSPYFSAFCVHENVLYYWGGSESGDVCAYRYELETKSSKFMRLSEPPGTDYFGYFEQPKVTEDGTVIFRIENDILWKFDLDLNLQKKPNQKPTYISPNS